MKRILACILAVLMLAVLCCGCGSDKKDETKSGSKILNIQIGPNPETIDTALYSAVDGGNMLLFAFDCLLNIDEAG